VRRSASEKMEIVRLVEQTDLPVQATLRQLDVPRSTFYGWYQRYLALGFDGQHDQKPAQRARWKAIPEAIQTQVLELALERTDLSPRELACHYTDEKRYFVSESSVYRILKAADLITSPAYVLLSASDAFKNPTTRVQEMWQTDFTYFRMVGWGWYRPRRLLALHHRLQAQRDDGGGGRQGQLDQALAVGAGVSPRRSPKDCPACCRDRPWVHLV
jgi:putative transposase